MSNIVIARTSTAVVIDGTRHRVRRGRTTAHPGAQIVRDYPDLWRPLDVDFPADQEGVEQPADGSWSPELDGDGTGEVLPPADPDPAPETADEVEDREPQAKDVRAWARAAGIDVPDRGKLPADVVERYKAEQG